MLDELMQQDAFLRIGLAFAAGLVVGFERESHGRAAGLRTTTLACVSAAVAMLLSEYMIKKMGGASGGWRPDPSRLAAGILTGMGFLGAGSIIRHENAVRGVTTAAVLWLVTILGLAFGSGYIALGLVGWVIALITLFLLPYIERWVKNDWYASVSISAALNGPTEDELKKRIESTGVKVKEMELEFDLNQKQKLVRFDLKLKKNNLFEASKNVVHTLAQCPGVTAVKWK